MITKYGTVESEVSKTAEGRKDAEEQRKTAEAKLTEKEKRHVAGQPSKPR